MERLKETGFHKTKIQEDGSMSLIGGNGCARYSNCFECPLPNCVGNIVHAKKKVEVK